MKVKVMEGRRKERWHGRCVFMKERREKRKERGEKESMNRNIDLGRNLPFALYFLVKFIRTVRVSQSLSLSFSLSRTTLISLSFILPLTLL